MLEISGRLPHALTMDWTVYIIRCDDDSLYTGVTTDLERRFREHLGQPRGAKYFNGRKPQEVVYTENNHTRASACRRAVIASIGVSTNTSIQAIALIANSTHGVR